jgi:hypothetical protein
MVLVQEDTKLSTEVKFEKSRTRKEVNLSQGIIMYIAGENYMLQNITIFVDRPDHLISERKYKNQVKI